MQTKSGDRSTHEQTNVKRARQSARVRARGGREKRKGGREGVRAIKQARERNYFSADSPLASVKALQQLPQVDSTIWRCNRRSRNQ